MKETFTCGGCGQKLKATPGVRAGVRHADRSASLRAERQKKFFSLRRLRTEVKGDTGGPYPVSSVWLGANACERIRDSC